MKGGLLRFFSLGVIDQALLSATNFGVGLLLLRRTDDVDYSLFVLATSTFLLMVGVQNSVVCGPAAVLATKKDDDSRLAMIGTLMRRQFIYWIPISLLSCFGFWLAGRVGWLDGVQTQVALLGALALLGVLLREFARELWVLYSHPRQLLIFDALYCGLYLLMAFAVTGIASPATPAVLLGTGLVSVLTALSSWLAFKRLEGWAQQPYPQAMTEAWRLGRWGLAGCVITWLHTQGFYYVVTGVLGVQAVATLAAARLLLMPVNLMVTGIGQLLLPMATGWLHAQGIRAMSRKILMLAAISLGCAAAYFVVLWWLREWIVVEVLKREVTDMDESLLLWGAVFGLRSLRAMVMVILQAIERFDSLTYLAILSTAASLSVGYVGIVHYGATGALVGLIVGELVDLLGIGWLAIRHLRAADQPTTSATRL